MRDGWGGREKEWGVGRWKWKEKRVREGYKREKRVREGYKRPEKQWESGREREVSEREMYM